MKALSYRAAMTAGLAVTGLIYLVVFAQSLGHLDRIFLPDDTYYTLSISRNLAAVSGPSTDGVTLTSGFQPLVSVLQIPGFWLANGPVFPVRWAIAVSGLLGIACIGLLGQLIARAGGAPWTVLVAMAFAATSRIVVNNAANGLETTLAGALLLMMCLAVSRGGDGVLPGRPVWLGVLCGLALLARIDACFLAGIVGLLCLRRVGWTRTALVVAVAAAVVAPWWIWCWWQFGTPIPESGSAVRQIITDNRAQGFTTLNAVFSAISTLRLLFYGSFGHAAELFLVASGMIFLVTRVIRGIVAQTADAAAPLAMAVLLMVGFYVMFLPAIWFFDRYFFPVFLAMIAAAALELDRFARRPSGASPILRGLPVVLAVVMILNNLAPLSRLHARISPQEWNGPVKGYAAVAQEILAQLPDGAVLGALQSGALGYFANRGIRVVNLDGVVSGAASRALADNDMAEYMAQNRVGYFADWQVNRNLLLDHSGLANPDGLLTPIAEFPPQQLARFTLFRVNLP